jgi:predicted nucleic acid-binding protein
LNYILDACALIAYLKQEPEGIHVKKLLDKAADANEINVFIFMSIVNLVEVYYGFIQQEGCVEEADKFIEPVYYLPVHILDTITDTVYRTASRFKGLYSLSLADAFAAATAVDLSAVLVTKDHEFETVEKNEHLSVLWIC